MRYSSFPPACHDRPEFHPGTAPTSCAPTTSPSRPSKAVASNRGTPDGAEGTHRETIDRMLAAIDLDWSRAALVSRLPWPTPGDGEPTASAIARFTPVVERLAEVAPPTHVLALGQIAADLAGPQARLGSSRGRWFDWRSAQLLPSIHPRIMAGNRELREQAFAHLKLFRAAIG